MKSGKNIGLYLSGEIYGHIAGEAKARGIPVTTWVREVVLAACPADVHPAQAGAKPKVRQPAKKLARRAAPRKAQRDKPVRPGGGRQEPVSLDALVTRHRDRVLDLDARGHLLNAICAITRLEYRVVAAILATRPLHKEMRP